MRALPIRATGALVRDLVLVVVLVAVAVVGTSNAHAWGLEVDRPIDVGGYALIVANGLVLLARRWSPLAVLGLSAVFTSAYLAAGYPYGPVFFPFFVAVYSAARHRPLARAAAVSAGALALLMIHLFTNSAALPGFLGVAPASAWVVVPFSVGVVVRQTREAAERQRTEAMRERVNDERLRIAQEVHDVVGHGLAAIKMQSDLALHLMPKKPEQAETALQTISRTSGEALEELRATLAVVRRVDAEVDLAPAAGLDSLDDLRRRMSDAGLHVDVKTSGDPEALPQPADLAGYRVVQESLTNVLKHGEVYTATVHIEHANDTVTITVSNPVTSVTTTEDGMGISGMRQRVTSLGGDFTAGPTDDGHFVVRASIPVDETT